MVKVSGGFSAKLGRIGGPGKISRIGQALFAGGERLADYAKGSIIEGSVTGKNHVASAPGEAPNANLRTLDGNIEAVQVKPLKVEVSSNAPYSANLEFGTSKMKPRPFMGPATAATKDDIIALVARATSESMK